VNLNKTEIFPKRCDDDMIQEALVDFPGKIGKFPNKYLGLPLHTHASYDEWTSSLCSTKSEDDFLTGKENFCPWQAERR
jgi:hypothetical protein